MYIYIYIYIIVLKTHLFSKIFFAFFTEVSSVESNLRKHQIKIRAAININ